MDPDADKGPGSGKRDKRAKGRAPANKTKEPKARAPAKEPRARAVGEGRCFFPWKGHLSYKKVTSADFGWSRF